MARVIQVIETYEQRGIGTKKSVFRSVYQLWTLDGELIFERDPHKEEELRE